MVEALKIPAHQPTSVGSMLPAPTATKIWLNTRNLDGELVLMGSAPVPIQLALIRTRTVKNAVAYWQVTVPPASRASELGSRPAPIWSPCGGRSVTPWAGKPRTTR